MNKNNPNIKVLRRNTALIEEFIANTAYEIEIPKTEEPLWINCSAASHGKNNSLSANHMFETAIYWQNFYHPQLVA